MSNRTFTLSDAQTKRVSDWMRKHFDTVHTKGSCKDVSGAAIEFRFIPTGLGDNVNVHCIWCKEGAKHSSINITEDFDDGTFLYDDDGKQLGW